MMSRIAAIGGGENGHHNTKYETGLFDREILSLSGKENPNFLFIGLANKYPDYYFEVMNGIYNGMYQCNTDHLKYDEIKDKKIVADKIEKADIIYVGGGNTYKLMTLLRRYEIDKMLTKAYLVNKVLCGVSAGAICWCTYGNSDSRRMSSKSNQLIRVKGLGFINVLFCPHYIKEEFRKNDLKNMMRRTYKIPGIALDNSALEIIDNKFRILKLDKDATAKKCFWKNNEYFEEDLNAESFLSIQELLRK